MCIDYTSYHVWDRLRMFHSFFQRCRHCPFLVIWYTRCWKSYCFRNFGFNMWLHYVQSCQAQPQPAPLSKCVQYLIRRQRILHNITWEQGTHFRAKELWLWAHSHWIHCSYHRPHHSEAASLKEQSKDQSEMDTPKAWAHPPGPL